MRTRLLSVAFTALALAATPSRAEQVRIAAPDGTALVAHWMPRPQGGVAPAVMALHGCGGLYDRTGKALDARYPEYVARLHAAGYHVLLPDSFGSRGSGSICSVPNGQRTITVETRRGDALAALDWLAAQPDVDPRRLALLGWSHGASTTLSALNASRATYARTVAAAVVFYPGCSAFLKESFELRTPMLMLLGEKDDWTPPERCARLAERARRAHSDVELDLRLYADSYHGFDSAQPVRFRKGIPNGVNAEGVHSGGNPAAREAALREVDAFLAARLGGAQKAASALPPTIR